jgi:hypothetical protein
VGLQLWRFLFGFTLIQHIRRARADSSHSRCGGQRRRRREVVGGVLFPCTPRRFGSPALSVGEAFDFLIIRVILFRADVHWILPV